MATAIELFYETRRKSIAQALKLAEGLPAEYNIEPLVELIERAWMLGYDVCNIEGPADSATGDQ